MTDTIVPSGEMDALKKFGELLSAGTGVLTACLAVGWSPAQMDRYMKDEMVQDLVAHARGLLVESIEEVLIEKAQAGHMGAIQMVLYNMVPERWRDRTGPKDGHVPKVDINIVAGAKESILELIQSGRVAELQPGGAIDTTAEG